MQTSETTLVGNITEISGGQLVATLLTEAEGFEPVVKIGSETLSVGQLGSQLLIKHRHINILGQVICGCGKIHRRNLLQTVTAVP